MRWNEADCHEQTTGELGIESKARGMYYFIRPRQPSKNTLGIIGIAGADGGIAYLSIAQAKELIRELPEIVEEYC